MRRLNSSYNLLHVLQLCAPLMRELHKICPDQPILLQRRMDATVFPVDYPKLLAKTEKLSRSTNEERKLTPNEKELLINVIQTLIKFDLNYIQVQTEFFISQLEKHLQQKLPLKKSESKTHEIYATAKNPEFPFLQISINKKEPQIELHYAHNDDIFDLSLDTRNKKLAAQIKKILGRADFDSFNRLVKPRKQASQASLEAHTIPVARSLKIKIPRVPSNIISEKKQSVTDFLSYFSNHLLVNSSTGSNLVQNPILNDSEFLVYSCQSQKAGDLQPFIEISLPKINKDDDRLKPWKLVYMQGQEKVEINLDPQLVDEKKMIDVVAQSMITRFIQQRRSGNFEYKREVVKLIAPIKKAAK